MGPDGSERGAGSAGGGVSGGGFKRDMPRLDLVWMNEILTCDCGCCQQQLKGWGHGMAVPLLLDKQFGLAAVWGRCLAAKLIYCWLQVRRLAAALENAEEDKWQLENEMHEQVCFSFQNKSHPFPRPPANVHAGGSWELWF